MAAAPSPGRRRAPDTVGVVLLVVAATQILAGVLALAAPATFYEQIASYPPRNDHFVRDLGSWQIALGLVALAAARRPAWRTPVLGILALQYALHAVSHAIDVGDPAAEWQGPVALALQVLGAAVLGALFLREARR